MEIKLFEAFSGKSNRLLFKDPKSNKALKESPDMEEYLQGVIDLGFTTVIVECSESRSKDKYLSLPVKIQYGDSENDQLSEDFENLTELMYTSLELKDRLVGDGWIFSGYSFDHGEDYFTQKYLTLWFGKTK